MYEEIIRYLEATGKSISTLMRHITLDYLRFKKVVSEAETNGR